MSVLRCESKTLLAPKDHEVASSRLRFLNKGLEDIVFPL